MTSPTVSIIVPTYNRARLLPRALDSILGQSFSDWEIVLVDDGSTDDTPAVAADHAKRLGSRFRSIRQRHAGSSAARNRGIEASRGRFVAFLDSDDEFLPTKLQRQLTLFESCPELGLVYSDYSYIDTEGLWHRSVWDTKSRIVRSLPAECVAPGLYVHGCDVFDDLLREYFIATIVGMVRREALGDSIRFPIGCSYAEEWLFYLQIARRCRVGFVNEPLCLHYFVMGSLSRTDPRSNQRRLYELLRRMSVTLPPLDRLARRTLRLHLARTCTQLGYDAYHDADYRTAEKCFLESFRHERRPVSLAHALDAFWKAGTQKCTLLRNRPV